MGVLTDRDKPSLVFRYTPSGRVPEYKFIDSASLGLTINNAGSTNTLNTSVTGTGASGNRIGQKIVAKHVSVRGFVWNTVANLNTAGSFTGGCDCIRVCLVYDKQPDGASPAYNSVFNSGAGSVAACVTERAITDLSRFIVMSEKILVLCATNQTMLYFNFEVDCDLETRYNQVNGGTFADIETGNIALMYCDSNAMAANYTTLVWTSRVTFLDE